MVKLIDLTGQKFGSLLVVERAQNRGGTTMWRCVHDNGEEWVVAGTKLRSGHTTGARATQRARKRGYGEAAKNAALVAHRSNARRRGLEDRLTDAQVFEIHRSCCAYCGTPPSNFKSAYHGGYRYNGIDRVDNTKGYLPNNCVPCCAQCNIAKGTKTTREFFLHCLAVAERVMPVYSGVRPEQLGLS